MALWQTKMGAVLAILLATFAGFGVVMCGTCILIEILKWRRRWLAQLNQQNVGSEDAVLPDQSSAATHQVQIDSQHTESNVGNSPRQMSWQNTFFIFSRMLASLRCLSSIKFILYRQIWAHYFLVCLGTEIYHVWFLKSLIRNKDFFCIPELLGHDQNCWATKGWSRIHS